jgi:hypothetical protein
MNSCACAALDAIDFTVEGQERLIGERRAFQEERSRSVRYEISIDGKASHRDTKFSAMPATKNYRCRHVTLSQSWLRTGLRAMRDIKISTRVVPLWNVVVFIAFRDQIWLFSQKGVEPCSKPFKLNRRIWLVAQTVFSASCTIQRCSERARRNWTITGGVGTSLVRLRARMKAEGGLVETGAQRRESYNAIDA